MLCVRNLAVRVVKAQCSSVRAAQRSSASDPIAHTMAKIQNEFFNFLMKVDDPPRPRDFVLKVAAYLLVRHFEAAVSSCCAACVCVRQTMLSPKLT